MCVIKRSDDLDPFLNASSEDSVKGGRKRQSDKLLANIIDFFDDAGSDYS